VSLPALYQYSEALGIVSAEFLEHHLLVLAAAVGNSHILAYLDTSEIATGLWSEEIKINRTFLNIELPVDNKSRPECPRPN
jgi:hypothetical protein